MNCRHHCSYADFGLLSCKKASDHTDRPSPSSSAVLPPPLNHGERKEKSPNCSTTLFGHCNATGTSPILGKVLNWNCIQCRIKASTASKLDVQLWAFALTTRSRSLSLGAECSFIYYWAQWHPAWCQACQVSTWDQRVLYCTQKAFSTCPTLEYLICNLAGMINVKITFTTSVRRVSSLLQKHQSLLERLSSHC